MGFAEDPVIGLAETEEGSCVLTWMTVWTLWVELVGVLPDASMVPSWRRRMVLDTGCHKKTKWQCK